MSTTPRPDRDIAAEIAASHLGRRTFLRSAVLGGAVLAGGGLLEAAWDKLVHWHLILAGLTQGTYVSCPRPTWVEFFLLEAILLLGMIQLRRHFSLPRKVR